MDKSGGRSGQAGRAALGDDEKVNSISPSYTPRTPLGREIMELWTDVVASGQPLIDSWEELEREVAERRGGLSDDDV